jgi:DNA-binding response OmpR family regulator
VTFAERRNLKGRVKRHVMLVDNDAGAAKVVTWILSQNQFVVKRFPEPGKALKEFKKDLGRYHVIIVDARMPGMTGFEFARRIRKLCAEIRIVLLTDFEISKSEFSKVFPSSQIDDIVVKPTAPRRLIQAVTGIVSSKFSNNPIDNGGRQDYQSAVY